MLVLCDVSVTAEAFPKDNQFANYFSLAEGGEQGNDNKLHIC